MINWLFDLHNLDRDHHFPCSQPWNVRFTWLYLSSVLQPLVSCSIFLSIFPLTWSFLLPWQTLLAHTRFMLLHDSRSDDGIKSFFQEVHELYVKVNSHHSVMTVRYYKILDIFFFLCNPVFFLPSSDIMEFSLWIFCCADIPQSTLLAWFSHRIVPFWYRSGRLQGNTFSKHSAQDPVVVVLVFPPSYILFSQCLIYAELVHKKMQLEPFVFTLINSEHCTRKLLFQLLSLVDGGYVLKCVLSKQRFVSAMLFAERCTK